MQSLLIAPSEKDLGALSEVLREYGLRPTSSVELGTGISLATANLSYFDAAVVVLPEKPNTRGLQTLLIETGIAAGRGLPLLVIVPPAQIIPIALANIRIIRTELSNRESLSLHIGQFAKSLGNFIPNSLEQSETHTLTRLSPELADQFETRLASLNATPGVNRGLDIQQFVVDLLFSAGANVEKELDQSDRRFDAAAFIPGQEEHLGLLVIEVKDRLDRSKRISAERQLQSYVLSARAGLGLLLYISSTSKKATSTTPLVLSMSIEELLTELRFRSISDVLTHARNVAAHRM